MSIKNILNIPKYILEIYNYKYRNTHIYIYVVNKHLLLLEENFQYYNT